MYGKTATSIHRKRNESKPNAALSLGLAALLIAILGLFSPNANLFSGLLPANCSTGLTSNTTFRYNGVDGVDGISAFAVWQNQGNEGDEAAFLKSLVGVKGDTGYTGKQGKSAYQLWLDAGNSGTSEEFLVSLVGDKGVDGVAGLSAYELWLSTGQNGTLQQFLNSLTGAAGTNGTNGVDGAVGPPGPAGVAGSPGAPGADGVCTIGAGGYYASFWDQQTQTSLASTNGMLLGYTGSSNGISAVLDDGVTPVSPAARGSWIKFDHAGTYNIAFSAQLEKTGGGDSLTSIWLQRYNGAVNNVDYTNTNLGMANNSTELVAAWNFFVDVAAGDRIRLAWHSSNGTVHIAEHPPVTNGIDVPGTPSVIVTVNQIR